MNRLVVSSVVMLGTTIVLAASAEGGLLSKLLPLSKPTPAAAPGTFTCQDRAAVAQYCAAQGVVPDAGGQVLQVCINDFTYYPPLVTPRQGDVVAWVNVENCADPNGGPVNIAEGVVANVAGTGCDTHHEVVTTPDLPIPDDRDILNARICSPYPSIPSTLPIALPDLAIDPGSCPGHEDQSGNTTPVIQSLSPQGGGVVTPTNVFCHKFVNVGAQHYTCYANPAHTALLHGGVTVLPALLPPLPELPDQPQL